MAACTRLLASLLLPLLLGGCVVVVSPFGWTGGEAELEERTVAGSGDAKILLTEVSGFISGEPTERGFGLFRRESTLARVAAELRKAARDDEVRAVVLRIDSPGGAVTASDELYARIRRFREETGRPVIAAIGNVGASGAYYVACAADTIVAHPASVTGSIGVILVNVDASGLMDKIGVRGEVYKSGEHKDLLSPLRGATEEERRIVQGIIESLQDRFVEVVRERRVDAGLATTEMDRITDGRVFDARTARELGLIDRIGRLHDALALAREAAGVSRALVIRYARPGERPDTVYSSLNAEAGGGMPINPALLQGGPRFLYLWTPASP